MPMIAALRLARLLTQRVDPRHGDLAPAAGRAAQVHHPRTGHEEAEFVVEFEDLVGRAPAIALAPRAARRVVQLPLQPARGGQLAPPRRLHLDPQSRWPRPLLGFMHRPAFIFPEIRMAKPRRNEGCRRRPEARRFRVAAKPAKPYSSSTPSRLICA
jgi:hypothetical protein